MSNEESLRLDHNKKLESVYEKLSEFNTSRFMTYGESPLVLIPFDEVSVLLKLCDSKDIFNSLDRDEILAVRKFQRRYME